jgi:hypothetical protein
LKGDGNGSFASMSIAKSGFFVKGDGKALAVVHTANNEDIFVATQNNDSVMVYRKKPVSGVSNTKWINLNPDDFCADITYKNDRKRRIEFYYGSTYLSQSSRRMPLDKNVSKIVIINFKGVKREVL